MSQLVPNGPKPAEQLREENLAQLLLTTEGNLLKHRVAAVRVDEDHQDLFERSCKILGWTLHKLKHAWVVEI